MVIICNDPSDALNLLVISLNNFDLTCSSKISGDFVNSAISETASKNSNHINKWNIFM